MLDFQLQLKIRKVTIIHTFHFQLHQRQASSYVLFLLFITSLSELPLIVLALLDNEKFSNPALYKNCHNTITAFILLTLILLPIAIYAVRKVFLVVGHIL